MNSEKRISRAWCHTRRFGLFLCVVWGCGGLAVQTVAQDVTQPQSAPSAHGGEETSIVDELSARLRKGDVQSAWELAQANRRELEGEPAFDALYARAALNVGAYQRASFALERTLMLYPDYTGVRLTLVEAYLGMGNTEAASRQLQRLDQAELNDSQRARWQGLSQVRDQLVQRNQTRSSLFTSVQTFYNTNISGGLTCSSCSFGTSPSGTEQSFTPAGDSEAKPAPGVSLQARWSQTIPVSQQLQRNVHLAGQTRISTYDDATAHSMQAGFGHQRNDLGRYELLVSPSFNNDGWGVYANASGTLSDVLESIDLQGAVSRNQSATDQVNTSLNITVTDQVESGPNAFDVSWSSGLLANWGDTELNNYWGFSVGLNAILPSPEQWQFRGRLNYQRQNYPERRVQDGKIGVSNTDKVYNNIVRGSFSALRPLRNKLQLSSSVSWRTVSSNDPFMETGGAEFALGVQRAW